MDTVDVAYEEHGPVMVARLSGEVDMTNTEELRSSMLDRLPHESSGLVVDLSALDYLDSAGIHLLYDLANVLQVRGQRLGVVVAPGSRAEVALRYAAVLSQLCAQPTVQGALAQFSA